MEIRNLVKIIAIKPNEVLIKASMHTSWHVSKWTENSQKSTLILSAVTSPSSTNFLPSSLPVYASTCIENSTGSLNTLPKYLKDVIVDVMISMAHHLTKIKSEEEIINFGALNILPNDLKDVIC